MSSTGSLGEADAKFPNQKNQDAIPPEPTRENPGGVYPKSDPEPETKDGQTGSTVRELVAGAEGDPFKATFEHAKSKSETELTTQEGPLFND